MKHLKITLSILPLLTLLVSCNVTPEVSSLGPNEESSTSNNSSLSEEVSSSLTSSSSSLAQVGYHQAEAPSQILRDANNSLGQYPLKSTGTQKLLVVPVQLSDGPAWTSTMLSRINTAMFGTPEETGYFESVASFYHKSSYGAITITGEVTNPLILTSYTVSSLDKLGEKAPEQVVIPKYYETADTALLKSYDQDLDGRVDATLFVYSNNFSNKKDSAYWAWVWYPDFGTNATKPKISTYFWVSYEFTNETGGGEYIDAHTFIHETGHVLGLDDYYNYDDEYNPAGTLEMQSYNVGDQGMFSKMELGWVNPYVLNDVHEDSVIVPLRSSALYPDALLLNDSWNGTPNDEYILIEYYTPEGNNRVDSLSAYSNGERMYSESGLRIYYSDARIVKLNSQGNFVAYSDKVYESSAYSYFTGASNSTSWSYLSSANASEFKLLSLQQSNVTSGTSRQALINGGEASRTGTLFKAGQTWKALSTIFPSGANTFNNGKKIGYSVSLDHVEAGVAYVRVDRI